MEHMNTGRIGYNNVHSMDHTQIQTYNRVLQGHFYNTMQYLPHRQSVKLYPGKVFPSNYSIAYN